MKTLVAAFAIFLAFGTQAADYSVNFKQLSTYSNDYKIAKIKEARFQVMATSKGGVLRYCYKDYESNFPYAPQKNPYFISQNLTFETQETTIKFAKLIPLFNKFKDELQSDLKLGCSTDVYLSGLVVSELEDGSEAHSDFTVYFKDNKVVMAASSYQVELKASETLVIDLIPTVFYGKNWQKRWADLDPAVGNPQSNY
ncbi:hypothetical protein [Halobacteriovorax sp. YZS-1-1]|uniref:hypothetical protein n=1 Tax=unclassified Halobacteriovorax TaxID=2639665 RepID=UPI00399A99C4